MAVNSVPLSPWNLSGIPPGPLIQPESTASATSRAVFVRRGTVFTYLENPSIRVRMYRYLEMEELMGPTRSMYTTSPWRWDTLGTCTQSFKFTFCLWRQTTQRWM